MRSFVNFIKFKIAPILLSVILLLFLPLHSLSVEAATIALPSNLGVGFDLYSVFRMFNLTGGIDTPSVSELPNYDELIEAGFTEEQYNALTQTQFDLMNSFSSGLGTTIKQAISNAVKYKVFRISYEIYSLYRAFLDSQYGSQTGTDCIFGSVQSELSEYSANTTYDFLCSSGGSNYPLTFSSEYKGILAYYYDYNTDGTIRAVRTYFIPFDVVTFGNAFVTVSSIPPCYGSRGGFFLTNGNYINEISFSTIPSAPINVVLPLNSLFLGSFVSDNAARSELLEIANTYRSLGYYPLNQDVSGTLVSTDEVLTSTNSIDSDGTISGDTSFSIPDFSFLNEVLDNLRNGVIDFATAVSSLGLSSVASDASTEDKEAAISSATSTITSVLTISEAGQTTVDEAKDELAESFSFIEAAEDTFRPYYDPESEDQDYVPNWFLDLPDLENPENDDSDDNHLVEIVQAIPVVTGLLTDLFDSSGPFKLLFYVGITFVMFSVLVGMAHFIGSYGDRKVLTSSPKVLIGSSNVPLITRKKG